VILQGAAIAIALALAWGGLQTWRLGNCQEEVAAAQQTIGALGADLDAQNAGIKKQAEESARRLAESAQARRKAEDRARVWDADAKRLRDALTARKPTDSRECKDAWAELRK
jgi:multidrug resistance efflux pump